MWTASAWRRLQVAPVGGGRVRHRSARSTTAPVPRAARTAHVAPPIRRRRPPVQRKRVSALGPHLETDRRAQPPSPTGRGSGGGGGCGGGGSRHHGRVGGARRRSAALRPLPPRWGAPRRAGASRPPPPPLATAAGGRSAAATVPLTVAPVPLKRVFDA